MASRPYRSPFTGDTWTDARPAIGTIIGIANYLNSLRPRRKPPENFDEAIKLATDAAGALAGIPKLIRNGEVEGRIISDAYWQAKEAKRQLTPMVDDGYFLQNQNGWDDHLRWQATYGRQLPRPLLHTLTARLAWWAAMLTEKAGAGDTEMSRYSTAYYTIEGAAAELDLAGVPAAQAASVERVWRFVVAAGRMPVPGVDDDLVAAFEAALMADAHDFANHLARHGWGQGADVSGADEP